MHNYTATFTAVLLFKILGQQIFGELEIMYPKSKLAFSKAIFPLFKLSKNHEFPKTAKCE